METLFLGVPTKRCTRRQPAPQSYTCHVQQTGTYPLGECDDGVGDLSDVVHGGLVQVQCEGVERGARGLGCVGWWRDSAANDCRSGGPNRTVMCRPLALLSVLLACTTLGATAPSGSSTQVVEYDPSVDVPPVRLACGGTKSGKPSRRFAYVLMHYEGTDKDREYILGTRVLIRSLIASGTQEDIVILASKTVSQSTIDQFCEDGVIVEVRVLRCFLLRGNCASPRLPPRHQ